MQTKQTFIIILLLTVNLVLSIFYCFDNQDCINIGHACKDNKIKVAFSSEDSLYKYFTKEEIKEKMRRAKELLAKKTKTSYDTVAFISKYQLLLKEDNFALPVNKLEEVWGKPINVTMEKEYISDNNYDSFSCLYPGFYLSNTYIKDSLSVKYITTDAVGFGFAGVYVGIPQCNKNYIKKLFNKAEYIGKHKFNKRIMWSITLEASTRTYLYIVFDKKGVVKKLTFEARSPVY